MYTFDDILENKMLVTYLQASIQTKRIFHSYLIHGPEGTGKKTIANIFATTLQCHANTTNPCLVCTSCKIQSSSNHPDIFYIQQDLSKKTIGISQIKDSIIQSAKIKPFNSKYKIYIIQNADTLTTQAQNALLKTIEQSPKYCIFIFVCNNIKSLLSTILSRCMPLKTNTLSKAITCDFLVSNYNISKADALIYSEFSFGSIGAALKLYNNKNFIIMCNTVLDLIINIHNFDLYKSFEIFELYKDTISEVFDIISIFFRDALVFKETKNTNIIIFKHFLDQITLYSTQNSIYSILNNIDCLNKTKYALECNANFQMSIEILILKLKGELL